MEAEAASKHPGRGNPDFVLTPEAEAQAMQEFETLLAEGEAEAIASKKSVPHPGIANVPRGTLGVTDEDFEIDKMLERAAKQNPITDNGPDQELKRESHKRDVLRNHIEGYKPASTIHELEDQVFRASQLEIDSIEATDEIIKYFCKSSFQAVRKEGYFIYKNIRVYFTGIFEQNKNADKLTMEQKLFSGGSKVDTVPIITPQKI